MTVRIAETQLKVDPAPSESASGASTTPAASPPASSATPSELGPLAAAWARARDLRIRAEGFDD